MIYVTKSFERVVRVDGVVYTVSQNKETHQLSIHRKSDNAKIYMQHFKDGYVLYAKKNLPIIKKIFNECHVERYSI